jgi:hypothetical protein
MAVMHWCFVLICWDMLLRIIVSVARGGSKGTVVPVI